MKLLKSIYKDSAKIKEISLIKAIFIIFMYLLIGSLAHFFATLATMFMDINKSAIEAMVVGMIINTIVSIVIVSFLANKYVIKTELTLSKVDIKLTKKHYMNIFLIIIGYILIREALIFEFLMQFEGPILQEDIDYILETSTDIELVILSIVMIFKLIVQAPILEELLFRGIIFKGLLSKSNNFLKALILSSIIFGIAHMNIPQAINATILGAMLGAIYYFTGSMRLCIFAHFINNFIIFVPVPESIIVKVIYVLIGGYLIKRGIDNTKKVAI